LKRIILKFIELILSYTNFSIIHLNDLIKCKKILYRNLISNLEIVNISKLDSFFESIDVLDIKSQFGQDIFVLIMLDYKMQGFFVEFGALDGIKGSNTYLLEKLGWNGILAEPSRIYKRILKNRKSTAYNLAVFSESNSNMQFLDSGSLSTLIPFVNSDHHNRRGKTYVVKTITLVDMLELAGAPDYIDYLSIDTEGSEYDILEMFDFNRYSFGIITIEHNFVADKRKKINQLLVKNGYIRVLENHTEVDDWYINFNVFDSKKAIFLNKHG
jgi:FkbM family methyltransferase